MTNSILEGYVGKLVRVNFPPPQADHDGIIRQPYDYLFMGVMRKTDDYLFTLHPYRVGSPSDLSWSIKERVCLLKQQLRKDKISKKERSITLNSREILSIEEIVGESR